jgi:hypothetical protein
VRLSEKIFDFLDKYIWVFHVSFIVLIFGLGFNDLVDLIKRLM